MRCSFHLKNKAANVADFAAVPKLSPYARLQTDKVSGQLVLVFPETVLVLNATGAEILKRCDGVRTMQQIAEELAAEFDAPLETISHGVVDYLRRMRERNLVSWQNES